MTDDTRPSDVACNEPEPKTAQIINFDAMNLRRTLRQQAVHDLAVEIARLNVHSADAGTYDPDDGAA